MSSLLLIVRLVLGEALAAPLVGEVWVYAPPGEARTRLTEQPVGFAESIDGDWVLVHGSAEAFDGLEAAGFTLRERRADHRLPPRPPGWEAVYHDTNEVVALLEELAAAWPEQAELIDLGVSREGSPIVALRVGTPGAPSLRVVAGHHGDELPAIELALATAEALLAEAPGFEGLLETREVWILPLLNPDGHREGSRYNADGVDLNRNYGFQWQASSYGGGPTPFSEPETRAARSLALLATPLAGLSLHAGAENIGYVYNYTTQDTLEEARLLGMAEAYAGACEALGFPVVQGADWFVTHGDANDWSFGVAGTLDFTVELSREKAPSAAALPGLIEDHLPAVAAFLSAPVPVEVLPLGSSSGRVVPVIGQVVGETMPAVAADGFHRMVEEGEVTVRLSALGYQDREVLLTAPDSVEVSLSLESPGYDLTPEPALIPHDSEAPALRLAGDDPLPGTLTLLRPGFDPVALTLDGDAYPLDLDRLAPGPWHVEGERGLLPRHVFIGTDDALVRLTGAELDADTLTLTGCCFGRGSRAWRYEASEHAPAPVPVLEASAERLVLDMRELPGAGTQDLLLWSNGRELAVTDLLGEPAFDPGADPELAPPDPEPDWAGTPPERVSYASCRHSTSDVGLIWLALLLPLLRRRRCAPPSSP